MINALEICNACEAEPMDPNSPAGYCKSCEAEARSESLKPGDRVHTLPAALYEGGETGEIVSIDGASVARIRFDDDTYWKLHTTRLVKEEIMPTPQETRDCATRIFRLLLETKAKDQPNIEAAAQVVDLAHYEEQGCPHLQAADSVADPGVIPHLNEVQVILDEMLQARAATLAAIGDETSAADEAWRAVHAQLEDLTPPEALSVLARVRADLVAETTDVALSEHFAGAEGPIEGLLEQLSEFGLQITERTE